MSTYLALLRNDWRRIVRDPMLAAILFGSLLLIVIVKFLFPVLEGWVMNRYMFDLSTYDGLIVTFLWTVIALLPGMMTGLLMLDERDENLIAYYAVTPFSRGGYLLYRISLPSVLAAMLSVLFLLASGKGVVHPASFGAIWLIVLEVPCMAIFLAAYAANKVEGLALSKACGLLFAGPIVAYFVPLPWSLLAAWIPSYWPTVVYLYGVSGEGFAAFYSFAVGIIFHLAMLYWCVRQFRLRVD